MESIEQFEGKKRKGDPNVFNDELQEKCTDKKGKGKGRGRKDKKKEKQAAKEARKSEKKEQGGEGEEKPKKDYRSIDFKSELKSAKFEFYYKVRIYNNIHRLNLLNILRMTSNSLYS